MPSARTDLALAPAYQDTPEPPDGEGTEARPHAALAPNQVRTSRGVVTIRETTGFDDLQITEALRRMGYNSQTTDAAFYGRLTALMCVTEVDGDKRVRPKHQRDLDALLQEFKSRDIWAITRVYATINGLGDDEDEDDGGSFRG